jgi:hypothetical protein
LELFSDFAHVFYLFHLLLILWEVEGNPNKQNAEGEEKVKRKRVEEGARIQHTEKEKRRHDNDARDADKSADNEAEVDQRVEVLPLVRVRQQILRRFWSICEDNHQHQEWLDARQRELKICNIAGNIIVIVSFWIIFELAFDIAQLEHGHKEGHEHAGRDLLRIEVVWVLVHQQRLNDQRDPLLYHRPNEHKHDVRQDAPCEHYNFDQQPFSELGVLKRNEIEIDEILFLGCQIVQDFGNVADLEDHRKHDQYLRFVEG